MISLTDYLVTNELGKISLEVPKTLSDLYTNSLVWAETHSNIVVAATEFAKFLSSSNFVNTATPQTIHNYGLRENTELSKYSEMFDEMTNSFRMYTYYPPSILGFEYNDNGPDPTNLWVQIPTTEILYGKPFWSFMPAIWHENKWKISFWGIRY